MKTVRMTVGQAIVKFLDNQYVVFDDEKTKFVEGIFTIFGHGNVLGLGQALAQDCGQLKVFQGRNEQGMAHAATGFAKQNNRRKIIACTSSIGPGAANMITAAATASVNNIPLLLFPGDTFATRQPDPVLQQVEQSYSLSITTNDAYKAVCKYFDRINRPEQLMSAMINAMRVLTDPSETGAVCIALPQDVQGESFDFPDYFFKERVHLIPRSKATDYELENIAKLIKSSKKPIIICGGGVRYSEAGEKLEGFCSRFNIPFAQTQAGKSACKSSHSLNLGGIGVTGNYSANIIAKDADLVMGIGTRFSDFTTGSKTLFKNANVQFVAINMSKFHASKLDAISAVGDAKTVLLQLEEKLGDYKTAYSDEIHQAKQKWNDEMVKLSNYTYDNSFKPLIPDMRQGSIEEFAKLTESTLTQTAAIAKIRELIDPDAIVVGASGSLPGDLQRMWTTDKIYSYHMEYGYSCMGYEVSAALGAKLACPKQEVYSMLGDGSYLMLHADLVTSIQEKAKINLLLFDNSGFGCINNLQMSNGIDSFATEFRYRTDSGKLDGNLIEIDFATCARGYGAVTYTVRNIQELEDAIIDSKKQKISTVIDIKVLPKTMTNGYESWWHTGVASTSNNEKARKAFEIKEENRKKARMY